MLRWFNHCEFNHGKWREEEPHLQARVGLVGERIEKSDFYRYVGIKSRGEAFYLLAMVIAARTATLRRGPCASGASMNVTDHHATDRLQLCASLCCCRVLRASSPNIRVRGVKLLVELEMRNDDWIIKNQLYYFFFAKNVEKFERAKQRK